MIKYLGYVIDEQSLQTQKEIKAILNIPNSKNITEHRAILSMINYYSKFLKKNLQCYVLYMNF